MTSRVGIKGEYRFSTYRPFAEDEDFNDPEVRAAHLIETGPWIHNLVMDGTNTGIGLITRRMTGSTTYDIQITTAEIGTGNTAPADGDTALVTPVLTGIVRSNQSYTSNTCHIEFFIPNTDLANGTYKEFLLRCGTQAFARSLITPNFTKGSNVDTGIEYNFTLTN